MGLKGSSIIVTFLQQHSHIACSIFLTVPFAPLAVEFATASLLVVMVVMCLMDSVDRHPAFINPLIMTAIVSWDLLVS